MQGRDGRSKGHGIVLFATSDDADKAQEMFNGYEWHGRPLEVREDRSIQDFVPKKTAPPAVSAPLLAPAEEMDDLVDELDKRLQVETDGNENNSSGNATQPANGTDARKEHTLSSGGDVVDHIPIKGAQDRTIHVGNIPFRVRWQDLKDLFRKAGHVVRADVALGQDNRSRGFGTVVFSNEGEAKQAISMFDQHHWQDRVIQVQEDRSGMENGRHHDRGNAHGPAQGYNHLGPHFRNLYPMNHNHNVAVNRQVFVGNLPFQCQWQDLKDLFRKAGNIIRADVAHGYDGRSRGFGSVLFATPEDAKAAISMFDNYEYNGRTLRVHYDRYSHAGHGPMHGNMAHMMHPHMAHHPHLHPHQPHHHHHHHPHRIHPIHAQHNHGFHGNFHQPALMPLGTHPMVHGGGHVPFNLGPPPFGNRNFSPLDPASNGAAEFPMSDGSALANPSPHSSEISGLASTGDRVSSATPFESSTNNATATIGVASPSVSASVTASATATTATAASTHGSFSSPEALSHPEPESPSQQYPFLTHLGPIGKPNSVHSQQQQQLHDLSNPGLLPGSSSSSSGALPPHNSSVGLNDTDDDDFGPRSIGNPYHFGNDVGDDERAFTPRFYMYPSLHQNQHQSQQQQQQHQQHQHQQPQSRQPQGQQQPTSQQQPLQPALASYLPPYQDLYSHEHLVHGRAGLMGGPGTNALSHGYPSQPEWMGHPNTFMMGPPQHMYGALPFGQYEHYRDLNNEVDDGEELLQQQDGY
ncbi:hypothetical protein BG015_010621 [Linnemannia schmuckeri]|uniref:RRM domain-containing protein n=1 Tax=Linnemannia schmuckeri TaxID=64567 RepID=A0A9P5S8K0_9FUNG|nr:hypothetical protein BG015_010621 [Linnemannia schmuckeri]